MGVTWLGNRHRHQHGVVTRNPLPPSRPREYCRRHAKTYLACSHLGRGLRTLFDRPLGDAHPSGAVAEKGARLLLTQDRRFGVQDAP